MTRGTPVSTPLGPGRVDWVRMKDAPPYTIPVAVCVLLDVRRGDPEYTGTVFRPKDVTELPSIEEMSGLLKKPTGDLSLRDHLEQLRDVTVPEVSPGVVMTTTISSGTVVITAPQVLCVVCRKPLRTMWYIDGTTGQHGPYCDACHSACTRGLAV